MSKYRGDQVKKIEATLLGCFSDKIPKFNSKTDPSIVSEFKNSDDAKWCLRHLNSRISAATKYIDPLRHHLQKTEQQIMISYFNCCLPFHA